MAAAAISATGTSSWGRGHAVGRCSFFSKASAAQRSTMRGSRRSPKRRSLINPKRASPTKPVRNGMPARQGPSAVIRATDILLTHNLCMIAPVLGVPARPAWGALSEMSPQTRRRSFSRSSLLRAPDTVGAGAAWQRPKGHSKSRLWRCCGSQGGMPKQKRAAGGARSLVPGASPAPALASPLDRHDGPSPGPASATLGAPLEVEHLGDRAEPKPQKEV